MAVLLETTLGDIVVDLYTEERPKACLNFLKLCKIKYYNYCLIHNVQRDFIVQTGDPTGSGRGGESVFCKLYGDQAHFFDAEKVPRIKHKKKGTVSMVNNGNEQHGSQAQSRQPRTKHTISWKDRHGGAELPTLHRPAIGESVGRIPPFRRRGKSLRGRSSARARESTNSQTTFGTKMPAGEITHARETPTHFLGIPTRP
ncbi:peptidyl-prolyl cis-trans isomerase-like 4 [Ictalurus furcatus]|uniref:peptidyl-prolyl cis-trans isomerase-like 4 n=1 Tax=Ictalurus furcatus TaxID=66913 RepID=UPI00234FE788|nr:peptidyl-prolyl cis-trans isomerase-like 4 [Ictalurus furcatus]